MALLWYQVYILWVELVHRASAGVEVACILFSPGLMKQQRVGILIHINGVYNWSIELWVHSQGPLLLTPHLQNIADTTG